MATTTDPLAAGSCEAEQAVNEPAKEKKHRLQGGYECIFVNDPPVVLQTECPICLCVLKEPYLIDCCGNSFCRTCIEPIKEESKSCPLCNVQFTTTMPDRRLQRTLNGLQVYCCHKEAGCEWVGELGGLTQHLNINFREEGDRLIGCELVDIGCTFCGDDIQRKDIKKHEEDICPERPYSCEYCREYESTYDDVVTYHWPICPSRPVSCPNGCGTSPKLEVLYDHIENECPLQEIDCSFKYAGCSEKLLRKDMPDHITQSLALHMSLQATNHQRELKKLTSRISELETQLSEAKLELKEVKANNHLLQETLDQECKNRVATVGREIKQGQEQRLKGHLGTLRGEIKKAQSEIKQEIRGEIKKAQSEIKQEIRGEMKKGQNETNQEIRGEIKKVQSEIKQEIMKHVESDITIVHNHIGLVPISFTMPDFQQKKRSNLPWFSPSFYTHPRGYKMCLYLGAHGWGENRGSHVGIALFMMPGDYDDDLKWPFRGEIIIQLLNQLGDQDHGHLVKTITVTDRSDDEFCSRVVAGERSPSGWGTSALISHTNLLPTYLRNDCLKLCIKEINITNN